MRNGFYLNTAAKGENELCEIIATARHTEEFDQTLVIFRYIDELRTKNEVLAMPESLFKSCFTWERLGMAEVLDELNKRKCGQLV